MGPTLVLKIKNKQILIVFLLFFSAVSVVGQNHTAKWYFGQYAGLDFMTNPPSILANSTLSAQTGCASVADANGNLLFYTNGEEIRNQLHLPMANGTGLYGNQNINQSCIIVKQPGSNSLYTVFTMSALVTSVVLYYSVVDMSLAAGMGSVTVKNSFVFGPNLFTGLTGTRHCNGQDVWIITREYLGTNFRAYLLSAAGVNTVPVISNIGPSVYQVGQMKISPNGAKLGIATATGRFDLYDFDNATGMVSNSLTLLSGVPASGCEFSPDGTKFYGSERIALPNAEIYQWDLCAGSNTAIVSSIYTVTSGPPVHSLQMAKDGKVYGTFLVSSNINEISNPNVAGAGCNFTSFGPSVSPNLSFSGLPNFVCSDFLYHPLPSPFTYTVNLLTSCQTASYTAPPAPITATGCAVSYSLLSMAWNFGDVASGAANTTTVNNPVHVFSGPGTYTTQLVFYYSCGGGTDTLKQVLSIQGPSLSVSSSSITCASLGSATITASGGSPPITYTWLPTGQTGSVASGLIPGNYSITASTGGGSCVLTTTTNLAPLVPLSGSLQATPSLTCNGANNGSALMANLSGGSPSQNYVWSNGLNSYTTATVNNLTAGSWSVTVTDALTACQINSVFTISQPPSFTLNITASSPSACVGSSVALSGTNSGGTPYLTNSNYTYSWTNGPAATDVTVSPAPGGNYTYTLTSADSLGCSTSSVIGVTFINNPVLALNPVSICPLQTGTLTVSGASTYTWGDNSTGAIFTDNPLATTNYSVTGSALGCTSVATASMVLNTVPVPTISANSPLCESATLSLSALGGNTYYWQGPNSYTASLQNPTINPLSLTNAGIYNLTVTAANGCTASAQTMVVIYPTPTLSAGGGTVCTSQTLNLTANSVVGATYLWMGPQSCTSTNQNISIAPPAVNQSGTYTVVATSTNNCINSATVNAGVLAPPNLSISLSSNSLCAQALSGSPNTITLTSGGAATYTLSTPNHILNTNPAGPSSPLSMAPPYLPTGPTTATLFGSNGVCTVSTSAVFTIVPNPTTSISHPTPVICAGENFTYTSSGASSYTWSSSNPANFIYTTGSVAVAHPSVNSVFSVVGGSLGCNSALQSSTLTVNPLPLLTVNNALICPGTSANLTATGNATSYTWSPTSFLNTANSPTVIASPPTQQNYAVTGELNNCTTTALVTVSVLPLPNPSLTSSKQTICLYDKVDLIGAGGQSYQWYGPGNTYLEGQQVSFTANNLNQSGTFTLTITDGNGCKNSITTGIQVLQLPAGTLVGNTQGCAPLCTQLSVSTNSNVASGVWEFNQQTFNGTSFARCFDTPGTYILRNRFYDAMTTCSNVLRAEITVYPKPTAGFEFYPDQPMESLDEVMFTNTSTGDQISQWSWYFIDNAGYRSGQEHTAYTFSAPGFYPVAMEVKNRWGCADTLVKTVRVKPFFNLYVPNAFTPNGDGLNDVFMPVGSGISDYQLLIYNRWGEKLFESASLLVGWDGLYKGEAAKMDTYNWKITAKNSGGEIKNLAGHVSLLK